MIIDTTLTVLSDHDTISYLADKVLETKVKNTQSQSTLNILEKEKTEIQKSITNLLAALEQGIFTASTKTRLEELELRLTDTESKIALEQCRHASELTKDKIMKFITTALKKSPQMMINILIDKIILYDDRIEIYYNHTDRQTPDDNEARLEFLFYSGIGSLPFSRVDNSGVEQRNVLVELYI